ncbi:tRNA guanosine(15) transglycosylase TgtA [Candidatus Bathyarchaeota archaeon]|nr:tRNA guanosine(15) transglycosylase TgtA [Candidatus Bathyarchaeota archaeon]
MTGSPSAGSCAVFEVTDKDVLGRVGKLHTKKGVIETPYLFPVVHPSIQPVQPSEMWEMGFKGVMTNAYLACKAFGSEKETGIHELLGFPGVVAMDSGAYQILTYGEIELTQPEIIRFQERVGSDIAVILDIPTGLTPDREYAERTVTETIRRADEAIRIIERSDILWVGPIQGGIHPGLVARCAEAMARRPFQILALGSPTQIMEQYMYRELLRMILTCKEHIPPCRPLHLFGGGHPSMLALAVSLGCDLFDSASYAIYARKGRYLTVNGTMRLEDLEYLPCSCSVCSRASPKELADSPGRERTRELSIHNLYACLEEMRRIKQSIVEGRLWELVMQRMRSHPRLFESVLELSEHRMLLERHSPFSKRRGIFFFDRLDLNRPEIFRFQNHVTEEYSPPSKAKILLMLPRPPTRPFSLDRKVKSMIAPIERSEVFHTCFYVEPYGVVPMELCEVYPVAQTEVSNCSDPDTARDAAEHVSRYLRSSTYRRVIIQATVDAWSRRVTSKVREACLETGKRLMINHCRKDPWSPESVDRLHSILRRAQGRCGGA